MTYELFIHPRVHVEAEKIRVYRERERPGSGVAFIQELDRCLSAIKIRPGSFQKRKGNFRHALLQKLKYRIAFRVEADRIMILEIRHTDRKPSRFGP